MNRTSCNLDHCYHEPHDYVSAVSDLLFPMSKFDVKKPSSFHKVQKNSVHLWCLIGDKINPMDR